MFGNVGSLILHVLAALALLVLPGAALLRLTVPRQSLDTVSRLAIAPGITVAVTVLIFTWCHVFGINAGPSLSWLFIIVSVVVLVFVRQRGFGIPFWVQAKTRPRMLRVAGWKVRRIGFSDALAVLTLAVILIIFLVVRFRATWSWCVPPGADSPQHTVIVQLLLENRGLFESWTPYSDAQTFTYHFGFHAVTALFAWLLHLDAVNAVFIMARISGVIAAASLFALVRLWTRNPWGGVFAVAFWQLNSGHLYQFDLTGRWTLLTGIAAMTSGLVLVSTYLRGATESKQIRLGSLCAVTMGGIVLTQYKSAIIFVVLLTSLVASKCLVVAFSARGDRSRRVAQILAGVFVIATCGLLLAAPRLVAVKQTKTGRYFNRIVFEAPSATAQQIDRATFSAPGIVRRGFSTRRRALVSALAVIGTFVIAFRKREALWFIVGWAAVTVIMNPSIIGSMRLGLIDQDHWKFAVPTAIATAAGVTVAFVCDPLVKTRSLLWSGLLMMTASALSLRATTKLFPLGPWAAYILPQELRLMNWIQQNVPPGEMIAGRGRGEFLPYDALIWMPPFTKHQTNHVNLAAALEQRPPDSRKKATEFTAQLYSRDMSRPESAQWMQQQGFRWFYVGALLPDKDKDLVDQLAHNPALEVVQAEGAARLYHVK